MQPSPCGGEFPHFTSIGSCNSTLKPWTPKRQNKKKRNKKKTQHLNLSMFSKKTQTKKRSPFLGGSFSKTPPVKPTLAQLAFFKRFLGFHASPWLCLRSLHHPPKSLEVVEDFEKIHKANVKMVATHQYLHLRWDFLS